MLPEPRWILELKAMVMRGFISTSTWLKDGMHFSGTTSARMARGEAASPRATLNGLEGHALGLESERLLADGDALDAGEGLELAVLHPLRNEEHVDRLGVENVAEAVDHVELNGEIVGHFDAGGGNRSRHTGVLVEEVEERIQTLDPRHRIVELHFHGDI